MKDSFYEYYFRIQPSQISFFRFLLEGYDGLATLTTVEAGAGLVKTLVPASRCHEFWALLTAVSKELKC